MSDYRIALPPEPRGVLVFGNTRLYLAVYPNAFHRLMQRLVFGFKWERP